MNMFKGVKIWITSAVIAITAVLMPVSCDTGDNANTQLEQVDLVRQRVHHAIAVLHPTEGYEAHGVVEFKLADDSIRIVADVWGLTPGKHGFHIHEYGNCSAEDASSAGGHFSVSDNEHAGPTDAYRHVGDMGNITADSSGHAHLELTDPVIAFEGMFSILGRSVVVHAEEDDLSTQPAGDAGPRVACGTIGIAGLRGGN